jgi:hypothetical protein
MSVAVIMRVFPFVIYGDGGGTGASFGVAGEGRCQAVEEAVLPEGAIGLLERCLPLGSDKVECARTCVEHAMVSVRRERGGGCNRNRLGFEIGIDVGDHEKERVK